MEYGDPKSDAEILRSAKKGKTKDEDKIIKLVTGRNNEQRKKNKRNL